MNTIKEFFNKLELENSNIEIEYNDMDIIIFNTDSMVGQIMLYNYVNDCEDTDANIELPFEYLTTIIRKFRGNLCSKETVLHFADNNEIMNELKDMNII